jgi:phage terminase large subunit GpA-like protein
MSIKMLAIDSGFNTQTVYEWAGHYPMNRVLAVKGQSHGGALVGAPSSVEVNVAGRKLKRRGRVWPVAVNIAKSELYGWLRLEMSVKGGEAPAGYCHFPEYDEEYFKELTAEQLVSHKTRRGYIKREWEVIPGRQNHVLDLRVYARAAAALVGLDRYQDSDWAALERMVAVH